MQCLTAVKTLEELQEFCAVLADGVIVMGKDGVIVMVNDGMVELTGYPRDELVGSGLPRPYWPTDRVNDFYIIHQDAMSGNTYTNEQTLRHKSGRPVDVIAHHACAMIGEDWHLVVMMHDITALNRRRGLAGHAEVLMQQIEKYGDIATWDWPLDGGRASVSDSYFRLSGHEPGAWEPGWDNWASRVHPDDLPVMEDAIGKVLSGESRIFEAEFRFRHASQGWQWMLSRGYVTSRDENGKPLRMAGTQQNIDQLKRQQEKLMQFQKMEVLGQLTAGLAHDFNNVLAIAFGALEIARAGASGHRLNAINTAFSALERARGLTNSLLTVSRSEASSKQTIDIDDFLSASRRFLASAMGPRGQLRIRTGARSARVTANRSALENALLNLVVNARDALEDSDGQVTIATRSIQLSADYAEQQGVAAGRYVTIVVSDNGRGMSEAVLMTAAEPLFTTKEKGKGTGLGLSMVRHMAQTLGGYIELRSEPGRGTDVTIGLPVSTAPLSGEITEHETLKLAAGDYKVLLVDDEVELLGVAENQLVALGYEVHKAGGSLQALELLDRQAFDLLLTDIVMPRGLGGVELSREVLARQPGMPVVFMTGYAQEAVVSEAREIGTLITKPFTIVQLAEALDRALKPVPAD